MLLHANVVDVTFGGIAKDVAVSIRGSLIERIDDASESPNGATVIDATGKFLIPGLWDMHVHLRESDTSFHALIANGITSVRVMYSGFPLDEYEKWRARPDAVRIAAAGMIEGPNDSAHPGALTARNEEEARLAVKQLVASRADFIEFSSNIPRDAYFAIADETRRLGASFAGPVAESVTPEEAAEARQLSMEGLRDTPLPLIEMFADDGTFQTPLLTASKYHGTQIRNMQHAGVHLLAGSDAGADTELHLGVSLHEELERMVELGLTPLEALQAATRNPALYFGTMTLMGTIEKGKAADVVLLDANPLDDIRNTRKIQAVVMRGTYYSRDALDAFEKTR